MEIEQYLDKLCRVYGDEELNTLRDIAKKIAPVLKLEKENQLLNKMIGALLGTKNDIAMTSQQAIARSSGLPYDDNRIALFSVLVATINSAVLPQKNQLDNSLEYSKNLAFFESYFSNYIEGTKFEVGEAKEIVFHNKPLRSRPEDSHDIISTFHIVSSKNEMNKIPNNFDDLVELLQARHANLMAARKEADPGRFKMASNRAGRTIFVKPELVRGTLMQGFNLYKYTPSLMAMEG